MSSQGNARGAASTDNESADRRDTPADREQRAGDRDTEGATRRGVLKAAGVGVGGLLGLGGGAAAASGTASRGSEHELSEDGNQLDEWRIL